MKTSTPVLCGAASFALQGWFFSLSVHRRRAQCTAGICWVGERV